MRRVFFVVVDTIATPCVQLAKQASSNPALPVDTGAFATAMSRLPQVLHPAKEGAALHGPIPENPIIDEWIGLVVAAAQGAEVHTTLVCSSQCYPYAQRWVLADPSNRFALSNGKLLAEGQTATVDVRLGLRYISHSFKETLQPSDIVIVLGVQEAVVPVSHSTAVLGFVLSQAPQQLDSAFILPVGGVAMSTLTVASLSQLRNRLSTAADSSFSSWLSLNASAVETTLPAQTTDLGKLLQSNCTTSLMALREYASLFELNTNPHCHTVRSYARVGIMGNPSDQFNGKTLSATIGNFWAQASIAPLDDRAKGIRLIPHPLCDPSTFSCPSDLVQLTKDVGYNGGVRLLQAACKTFFEYCAQHKLLDSKGIERSGGFSLSYDTFIPRQVGLAGSSAIVTSVVKCLCHHFKVDIAADTLPDVVLAAERDELGISAGLQDRVVQCYGGVVHMDFAKKYFDETGHGRYDVSIISPHQIPELYLAVAVDPSDSGKIHNSVRQRFLNGDQDVLAAVECWRRCVDDAVEAICGNNPQRLYDTMNANFQKRLEIYGKQCLGWKNMEMIDIATQHGAAAKFPGSGGAIIVFPKSDADEAGEDCAATLERLRESYEDRGYVFIKLRFVSNH